jgi:hypothetical protein
MKKQVYRFNDKGHYIEPVLLEEGEEIPSDCTEKELPQPNMKPVFKDGEWVEIMSDEEIDEILNQPIPKSEIDILKEENAQLTLDIINLWETLLISGVIQ